MIIRGKLGQAALGLGAVVAAAVSVTAPASAQQVLFDWGGGNTSGGSGRETVSFSPKYAKGQVIVSFGDRRLYYVTQQGQALSYPIAIPREQSRWAGVTAVSQKRENPSWTPTPTMIAENPRLPRWVPGGHPMNPLGNRALYLGSSMYRIHGTDAPWTIGSTVSKGCIRLYNQDVADLYPRVSIGTKVTVTWDRFTTTASANSAPPPAATQSGNSGGNLFDLFGDDDEPVQKAPPRRTKSKAAAKSASVE